MAKKLGKAIGIGGTGAAAGAYGMEALGLSAVGTVGYGIGFWTSAIIFGAAGGGVVALALYGLYKCFTR